MPPSPAFRSFVSLLSPLPRRVRLVLAAFLAASSCRSSPSSSCARALCSSLRLFASHISLSPVLWLYTADRCLLSRIFPRASWLGSAPVDVHDQTARLAACTHLPEHNARVELLQHAVEVARHDLQFLLETLSPVAWYHGFYTRRDCFCIFHSFTSISFHLGRKRLVASSMNMVYRDLFCISIASLAEIRNSRYSHIRMA